MEIGKIHRGNKAIAEFMGATVNNKWKDKLTYLYTKENVPTPDSAYNWSVDEMRYHSDWGWIMPVVEKISLDYDFTIRWFHKDCVATIYNTSLENLQITDAGNFKPAIINVWRAINDFLIKTNKQ